jgi:mRNA-degrading endonuclease RelE of RelBE toxin-antitoxin system
MTNTSWKAVSGHFVIIIEVVVVVVVVVIIEVLQRKDKRAEI